MWSVRRAVGVSALSFGLLGGGGTGFNLSCPEEFICGLFGNPLEPCLNDSAAEGEQALTVVLERIDLKAMPLGVDDDEDPKDVSLKDRRKFKPSKGSETGLDRRFRMMGKRDDSAACLSGELDFTTPAIASVRLAIDTSDGLVDGESLAFLERRVDMPGEGVPGVLRVEAVWTEDINGLTTRARVDGELMGTTAEYPDTTEVFVQVAFTSVNSYTVAGHAFDSFGDPTSLVNGLTQPESDHRFAFGIEGVGKKGRFWFAQLAIQLSSSYIEEAEAQLAFVASSMLFNVGLAEFWFGFPTAPATNVDVALGAIDVKASNLFFLYTEALENDQFAASTDLKMLKKAVTKANLRGLALGKKSDAAVAKGALGKVLQSPVKKLRESLETLIGLVHGFDSLSNKRLKKSAGLAFS